MTDRLPTTMKPGRDIMREASLGYPPEWISGAIQARMYEWAGWRCEHCGMEFEPGSTKAKSEVNADGKPVILTVHHLDGNPANCDWRNLLVSCQRCHLSIQATWKPGGVLPLAWGGVPEWVTARGLDYQENPQLALPGFENGGAGGSR